MSAYAATITNSTRIVRRIAPGFGFIFGSCDLTNYNQTGVEIKGITGYFAGDPVVVPNSTSDAAYEIRWDATDKAFHAYYAVPTFSPKPILVVEEVVAVATHAGTLEHLPAYIIAIEATTAGTTGANQAVPTGEVPSTLECAVTFTTGGLIFNTADAVTEAKVTYFPQRDGTMFAASNMVIDEAVTVDVGNKQELANRAACVQYVYNVTNTAPFVLEPVGEAPNATGNAVVDITNAGSETDIDFHADDTTDDVKVTYLKYAGSESPGVTNLGDGDQTITSEEIEWPADTLRYGHFMMPGLGTIFVGETGASANITYPWSPASISAGAGVVTIDPILGKIDTDDSTAIATTAMPWIVIDPLLMSPEGSDAAAGAEVANDVNVGVFQFIAFGVVN